MKRALTLGLFFAAAAAIHCGSGGGDTSGSGPGGDDGGVSAQSDAGVTPTADSGAGGDDATTTTDAGVSDAGANDATAVDAADDASDAAGGDAASDAGDAAADAPPPVVNATVFAYDQEDRVIGEYDQSGKPLEELVYLGDRVIATVRDGKALAVQTDQLTTPRTVFDGTKPVWSWDPEPFGDTPPNEDVDGDGKKVVFDERFPGQRHDALTNLAYNFHRNYAPEWGRYVEADPIGLAGGINRYAYAWAVPMANTDPRGLGPPDVRIDLTGGGAILLPQTNQAAFVEALTLVADSGQQISSLEIVGHGSSQQIGGMGWFDILKPDWDALIDTGFTYFGPNGAPVDIAELLRRTMRKGGRIYLNGCNTGAMKRGSFFPIARQLSSAVPGVTVQGNKGIAYDTHYRPDGVVPVTVARPRTFFNGNVQ